MGLDVLRSHDDAVETTRGSWYAREYLRVFQVMSEEEIIGMLRHMQERLALLVDILTRIETRQIEVKKEIESEPEQGSFGTRDK